MMTPQHHPTFLLLGEAVVDLISSGVVSSLEEANSFQRFPGGEVTNLAMNLARLGHSTALGAGVGDDGFGRYLKNQLEQAGVSLDLLQIIPNAPTTLIPVSRQTETPDFIIYRGADKYLRPNQELRTALSRCHAVHTSAGSLSHNPCRSTILELLEAAHQQGKIVSLDPNYHPNLWPDRADFIPFLKEVFQWITVTKPSLDDSKRIFGSGLDPREYLDSFLELGPEIVTLTMGRSGVLVGTAQGERFQLEANPISVVDVTGAGDAFWSGLLTGLISGASVLESSRLGQAVAEHKIGVLGPVREFPSREEFQRLAKDILHSPAF
ncbi:MAG: carbohydrate kinase family protein [Anaerolineales bacterium]|nr:carbohydrate kinase family protein [Anaerolineales bacterium]